MCGCVALLHARSTAQELPPGAAWQIGKALAISCTLQVDA